MPEYRAVYGSILNDEQAETFGRHLHQLKTQNGGLRPEDIVEDARDLKSPLHDWFQWDDTKAAERYRETQAQYLLRSINVVVKYQEEEWETRLFYNVIVQERAYYTIDKVLTEDDIRAQVIEKAKKSLTSWTRIYGLYEELFDVTRAIEEFLE